MALDILKSIKVAGVIVDPCNNCWPSSTLFEIVVSGISDGEAAATAMTVDITVDNVTTGTELVTTQLSGVTDGAGDLTLSGTLNATPTTPGEYRLEIIATVGTTSTTEYTYLLVCPNVEWERTACKSYTITTDSTSLINFKVYDLDATLLHTVTFSSGAGSFTLAEEGVYLVQFSDGITYSLYEFCELQACLKKLIREILCPDLDDPCCTNCREEDKIKRESIRKELNKLIATYGMYLGTRLDDATRFVGVFDPLIVPDPHGTYIVDGCETELLRYIDNMIDDIKEITRRCGTDCDELTSTSPCASC